MEGWRKRALLGGENARNYRTVIIKKKTTLGQTSCNTQSQKSAWKIKKVKKKKTKNKRQKSPGQNGCFKYKIKSETNFQNFSKLFSTVSLDS